MIPHNKGNCGPDPAGHSNSTCPFRTLGAGHRSHVSTPLTASSPTPWRRRRSPEGVQRPGHDDLMILCFLLLALPELETSGGNGWRRNTTFCHLRRSDSLIPCVLGGSNQGQTEEQTQ